MSESQVRKVLDCKFAGCGTLAWDGDWNPWGAVLPKRYRVTRVEWMPRLSSPGTVAHTRCGSAKFYISDSVTPPASGDLSSCTQIGAGYKTGDWCDGWNQIFVNSLKARTFLQQGDGNGNEAVRIWGEPLFSGLAITVR